MLLVVIIIMMMLIIMIEMARMMISGWAGEWEEE